MNNTENNIDERQAEASARLAKRSRIRRGTILVLLVALAWTYLYMPKFEERQRMDARLKRLKAEVSQLEKKKINNQYKLSALKGDPVTIEREIRDNLGWVAPGEVPVLNEDSKLKANNGNARQIAVDTE